MKKGFLLLALLIGILPLFAQQNWFNEELRTCIILLEKEENGILLPHGTGFIIYNYKNTDEEIVVTCEHVLRNKSIIVKIPVSDKAKERLKSGNYKSVEWFGKVWLFDGYNLRTNVDLVKNVNFYKHDSLDIAAFKINFPGKIMENKDTLDFSIVTSIPKSMFKKKNQITLGTEIYFLGFPFAIGTQYGLGFSGKYSDKINNPLIRTGILAWKAEEEKEFLLDAFSFTGNSGSPIFTKSGVFEGNNYLIGMTIGHLGQDERNNIGLARCLWIDDIITVIDKFN